MATIEYHDNHSAAIAECGRVINTLIPVVYDTPRQIRIVGEDEKMSVIKVNDPKDPKSHDMSQGQYDIVVETGPSYSTKRVEAAEMIMQLVQSVPAIGEAAGDLLVRALDLPDGDKIADRLKAMMPPQIQQADQNPDDMKPEERQAYEQQKQQEQQDAETAKQLQETMAKLGLEEKSATIGKLRADTAQTQANADKMQAETKNIMAGPQGAPDPAIQTAEVRKANAGALKAEYDADAAKWNAILAEANAIAAGAAAHGSQIDTLMAGADAAHILEHGRGITDPEPIPQGAGESA